MATLIRVPEVAAGATEVVVSEWLVAETGAFAAGDALLVIETDKAVVEVPAEVDGVLLSALVAAGSTVEVGSPLAVIGHKGERAVPLAELLASVGVADAVEQPAERVFSSPLARRMLRDAGLPLDSVRGTGPRGRIVRRDVEAAIESARAEVPVEATGLRGQPSAGTLTSVAAPPIAPSADGVVPHSRMRRAIATRLVGSKREVPHFYVKRTAAVDELLELRSRLNKLPGVRVSINDLVVRAVGLTHSMHPEVNVMWTDAGTVPLGTVDVGVAVALDDGLVTPVVRGADRCPVSEIGRQIKEHAESARSGRLRQQDLEGGSITVSNLGMYGVEEFAAIINPPQSAILAVGAATPAVAFSDGVVVPTTRLTLVLSADHRVIDGAMAGRWMETLVGLLESPLRLVA
jgi:pyruvate dehydrogenase E2 component (dihydrolipoamide acetyltransferase)